MCTLAQYCVHRYINFILKWGSYINTIDVFQRLFKLHHIADILYLYCMPAMFFLYACMTEGKLCLLEGIQLGNEAIINACLHSIMDDACDCERS